MESLPDQTLPSNSDLPQSKKRKLFSRPWWGFEPEFTRVATKPDNHKLTLFISGLLSTDRPSYQGQ